MTNCIQFIDLDNDFIVSVTYETGEDISKITHFESTRIKSLQERSIKIKSEVRTWDFIREISVRDIDF